MKQPTQSDRVRRLVRESGRTRAEIAELLGVSVAAVNSWMCPDDNHAHRSPPLMATRLLERLVAELKQN